MRIRTALVKESLMRRRCYMQDCGSRNEEESGETMCMGRSVISVSYTHLDVYKRQQ